MLRDVYAHDAAARIADNSSSPVTKCDGKFGVSFKYSWCDVSIP